jgi:hypothetical protein
MADKTRFVYAGYSLSAPGASTDIFTKKAPGAAARAWRITIALTVSSVLNMTATDGSTAHAWGLNASLPLEAADLYVFEVPVKGTMDDSSNASVTYSLQVETDGVIEVLLIEEIINY